MEAETSRRKSTRWVEFMAEGSIAKQQNSKKHVEEERVEYAQCEAGTEELMTSISSVSMEVKVLKVVGTRGSFKGFWFL